MKDLYEDLAEDIEIIETDDGYMVFDHQTDDYLYDENKDNCFDDYFKACKLADDLIQTRLDHLYD
jgi:hypothetical protein